MIKKVLRKYYNKEGKYYSHFRYDKNDKEYDIAEEVIECLQTAGVLQLSVVVEDCFDSCGYSCDMLCCAWIDVNGKLKTENILLECM
ncbi:MAG: hypothetical protein RR313_11860 [Anaerovoracaceae bacterium]